MRIGKFLFSFISFFIAGFLPGCSSYDDNKIDKTDKTVDFNDSTKTVITEELEPELIIRHHHLSQKADTFRVVREGRNVAVISLSAPIIVSQANQEELWGFYQFPQIHRSEDGMLVAVWSMRNDSHTAYGDVGGGCLVSNDNGGTWRVPESEFFLKDRYRADMLNGDILQVFTPAAEEISKFAIFPNRVNGETLKNGYDFYYESELPNKLRGVYFDYWNHTTKQTRRIHANIDDPGLLRYAIDGLMPIVWWGNIKELDDGSLVAGVEGTYYQDAEGKVLRSSVGFFKSTDKGYHWKGLSRIHYQDSRHDSYPFDGAEGFTEPAFEVLNDGTFLCVMRCGSHHPMFKTFSKDGGLSWSKSEPFTSNGVRPNLLTLENGALVLASGRPGVQVRFCLDGDGLVWTEPIDMVPFMNESGSYDIYVSCGYTGILPIDENSFYMIYSDFKTQNSAGEIRKSIIMRKIDINLSDKPKNKTNGTTKNDTVA